MSSPDMRLGKLAMLIASAFKEEGINISIVDTCMMLQFGVEAARKHPEYMLAISQGVPFAVPEKFFNLLDEFIKDNSY